MNPDDATAMGDLYEVLEIATSASPEVVDAAYRGLTKKYGSDPNPAVREKRRELDHAYEVLSDAGRRAAYDRERRSGRAVQPPPPAPPVAATNGEGPEPARTWPKGIVACPRDPSVETALRCSRCETPICPKCLIQTPVGARCRDCARMSKSPVYTINNATLARAVAAAVIAGVVAGIAWGILARDVLWGGGWFIAIVVGAGLGVAFGRMMDAVTGRKRGPAVVGCAIGGLMLAFGIQYVIVYQTLLTESLISVALAIYLAYDRLR